MENKCDAHECSNKEILKIGNQTNNLIPSELPSDGERKHNYIQIAIQTVEHHFSFWYPLRSNLSLGS